VSDRLRFEQEPFHRELFKQLRLTPAEAEQTRDGLDIRTLALPPGGRLVLRLIRHWPVLRAANWFGASALLAMPSILSVICSGAVGLLSVDQPTAINFLEGGRAFQRLWLAATAAGLQLQPLGSLPIFLAHLDQLGGEKLTKSQQSRAKKVEHRFLELVPELKGRTLLMAFRIGYGKPPRYRSLRRKLEDVLIAEPPAAGT